ncbi:MAG TPA: pyridoxamine 5'-phosphate oxidase family protein [Mycobacteriales bacterium]|nr:pyridoxamine 5'-phosphate oxidase family protein [Mycobacteriales bacterium]
MGAVLGATARTRLRRLPENAVDDRAVLHAILDEGLVAHVSIVDGHHPFVLPCAYARDGDRMLLHGSSGSRLLRSLAAGVPACITVTLLDGLVVARSLFHSSMHYRSAMVLGRAVAVPPERKLHALQVLSEHLMPGRWADARPPSRKELAATMVVTVPLDEASVKVSKGLPSVEPEDADWDAWSGVVPLRERPGEPQSVEERPVPAYVREWRR